MPANLTPEFKTAQEAFRKARDPKERLEWLREMLRMIPKHKGTDHLQADIKTRIKELTEELAEPKKGGSRHGPSTVIRPEGAAQIALIGPPNSGKSSLHAKLTGSNALSGSYPFTTRFPQPGMLPYEDVYFQLIDLPPLAPEHPVLWIANALQPADACLLVVDLSDPGCVDQVMAIHAILAEKRVTLSEQWDLGIAKSDEDDALSELFALCLPTLMITSKADRSPALQEELAVFQELTGLHYPVITVSTVTGAGLEQIGSWLFHHLGIVRVYTKVPGRPPDRNRPFTVRFGQTVQDVALLIHREFAKSLKYARLWRADQYSGQQVGLDYAVADGDIVELHT
jgi:ribosome-interacting GTPase 1